MRSATVKRTSSHCLLCTRWFPFNQRLLFLGYFSSVFLSFYISVFLYSPFIRIEHGAQKPNAKKYIWNKRCHCLHQINRDHSFCFSFVIFTAPHSLPLLSSLFGLKLQRLCFPYRSSSNIYHLCVMVSFATILSGGLNTRTNKKKSAKHRKNNRKTCERSSMLPCPTGSAVISELVVCTNN